MPLLESGYRAAAKTELERNIRELEAKDRVAQSKLKAPEDVSGIQSNITFAQRLNLVSEKQAQEMKRRVEIAVQHNQFMRNESEERIDDFENPRERAERYFDSETLQAEISRERAAAESERINGESRGVESRSAGEREK